MSKAIKATLLSALVLPGTGHFFLKKYIIGALLASASLASLYVLISRIVEKALLIVEKIQLGGVQPDISTITELLSKQPTGTDAHLLSVAGSVLMLSWLIGIIDSYRVGHIQDKSHVSRD